VSTSYPKRENFHAFRVLRALSHSADAPELGPTACWLVTIVVIREDQLRYEQAPQFYNQHLMTTMGMSCAKQLDRARDKAVERGWLHYERCHNRAMGRYWSKIPRAEQEHEEPPHADNQGSTTANVSTLCPDSVPKVSRECPDSFPKSVPIPSQPSVALLPVAYSPSQLATEQQGAVAPAAGAAPLSLSSESAPAPAPAAKAPKVPKTRQPKFDASTWPLPLLLNTPAFRVAWESWNRYLCQRSPPKPMCPEQAAHVLDTLVEMGEARAIAAIKHTIAKGWQGLREPEPELAGNGGTLAPGGKPVDPAAPYGYTSKGEVITLEMKKLRDARPNNIY
jgi:hypothetical protein